MDSARLQSNLNYVVEHTDNFGVEKLSNIWFEIFDLIESCRLLPSDELIFEVSHSSLISLSQMSFLRL